MSYNNQIQTNFDPTLYQGVWDANANAPVIVSGVGIQGAYYIVNVPGNTNIDGHNVWNNGDWIIFNGVTWDRIDMPAEFWDRLGTTIFPSTAGDSVDLSAGAVPPAAPSPDTVRMYIKASGVSPNREVSYCVKDEQDNEVVLHSVLV